MLKCPHNIYSPRSFECIYQKDHGVRPLVVILRYSQLPPVWHRWLSRRLVAERWIACSYNSFRKFSEAAFSELCYICPASKRLCLKGDLGLCFVVSLRWTSCLVLRSWMQVTPSLVKLYLLENVAHATWQHGLGPPASGLHACLLRVVVDVVK